MKNLNAPNSQIGITSIANQEKYLKAMGNWATSHSSEVQVIMFE